MRPDGKAGDGCVAGPELLGIAALAVDTPCDLVATVFAVTAVSFPQDMVSFYARTTTQVAFVGFLARTAAAV